jgi:hypothetical protein
MRLYRIFTILSLAVMACGCSQKLPYDLEGVEKTVAINIHKPLGAGAAMSTDKSDVFQIILDIPRQQGDYSMLKEAQLMAIYTSASGSKRAGNVIEGIKEFPCTLEVSLSDVCEKMNIETLAVGDRFEFTPSHTLKSGLQVDGWSQIGGFNNKYFSGWIMEDGSSFSNRISYTAFAPFVKANFIGDAVIDDGYDTVVSVEEIDELPEAKFIPVGVTADKLIGLKMTGDIWFGGDVIKMWINTNDYTLIIPDQIVVSGWEYPGMGVFDAEIDSAYGEVDTLNSKLIFTFYPFFGGYSWGVTLTYTASFGN